MSVHTAHSIHSSHSNHSAVTASTRVAQPSAGNATITELREQIIADARMLYPDIFKRYLSGKGLIQGPVRREEIFDIVIIRKPSAQGITAVLVYGRPESRRTALQSEEKRSYFDAMESLLLCLAGNLGEKSRIERDGSKSNFF
ncbi:uncharacterized protein RCC_00084 [Ramularia collo-cygni]|uniref:Uncharacterized protein n=1 Tax=Ramularia collo-cygni TaxID=112498 RepID=A0A2D3UQ05_9PEZI|nr:uncharacterized protein RCC_00084 [Ramularia collo-cygni]CZT14110.1 uncharacterized protein RCC_00084 [Ramularia collo-cygni]